MQITALAVLLVASASLRVLALERTATFQAQKNVRLMEHVIERKQLSSILSCAQLCLALYSCVSFNYKNLDKEPMRGSCELNNCVPRKLFESHLVRGSGWVFGLLESSDKGV